MSEIVLLAVVLLAFTALAAAIGAEWRSKGNDLAGWSAFALSLVLIISLIWKFVSVGN
jgi:hypothetical protein